MGTQPRSAIEGNSSTKDLADKPAGYVSPAKTMPDGFALYKIVSVTKAKLPPDYATRSAKYLQDYRDHLEHKHA